MLPIGATVSNDVNEFRGEFFSEQEAADAADKSVRTLRAWRQRGEGPPYVLFGRTVKYRKDAFMEHFRASEIVPPRMRALIGSTTRQPKQFNSRSLVVKTPARIAVRRQRRGD
jgi:Helix-turn-helix domain